VHHALQGHFAICVCVCLCDAVCLSICLSVDLSVCLCVCFVSLHVCHCAHHIRAGYLANACMCACVSASFCVCLGLCIEYLAHHTLTAFSQCAVFVCLSVCVSLCVCGWHFAHHTLEGRFGDIYKCVYVSVPLYLCVPLCVCVEQCAQCLCTVRQKSIASSLHEDSSRTHLVFTN